MSIRDEFDTAWSRGELLELDGPFNDPRKNQAWATWQASRAAIVIELPDTVANTGTLCSTAVLGYKREVRDALTDVGLTVKP